MAVCNLLNTLSGQTGNFLMFSQYSEDLTGSAVKNEAYRVVPSMFIALDVDYSEVNKRLKELNIDYNDDLNTSIPMYLQNYFENSCAYIRTNPIDPDTGWYPSLSSNLFWKALSDIGIFHITLDEDSEVNGVVDEVRWIGDINIHSYDVVDGMGYGEVYCYIPTNTGAVRCKVLKQTSENFITNEKETLEGYDNISITDYPRDYYPDRGFVFEFDEDFYNIDSQKNNYDQDERFDTSYDFNTVIVLYDIHIINENGEWVLSTINSRIPMGIYFAGMFDEEGKLTNPVRKYITDEDAFGMGSSYGLRICTRFVSSPTSKLIPQVSSIKQEDYSAYCRLMTSFSEMYDKMNDVISNAVQSNQNIKNALSVFKNNRINVPYLKEVNGDNYWFVNGKCLGRATLTQYKDHGCDPATMPEIQEKIDSLESELSIE